MAGGANENPPGDVFRLRGILADDQDAGTAVEASAV
jgi:hypothetical protein